MVKKLCCLLLLVSLVACSPANPPQAIDAYGLHDYIQMNGLGVAVLPDE
ncbi:hypothetical protein HUG15_22055 [Salicibibacter cibarius]|uniref:Uncharacterized protein n=1 Tax=Salicibibacter cibarius TaxID=2743000 RepID=A0A7T6Z6P6_9BACI|nr:hypothetical protein [Salicibibacter cibarius]QQK78000.1 hypothetical protein HUG15_22055 [Salicibibacter cibarius]